jgi:hypothetical protein
MEALQTTLAGRVLGTDSAWPANASSWAAVFAADVLTLSLVGEVYFDPKYIQTTVQTNVNQALRDWAATLPIGGLDYSPGPPNAVLRSDLYAIIESVRGVRGVQLTSPNEQFLASARSLIVPSTINLSYTATVSSGP